METYEDKYLDAQRDIIRHSLPELVNDIGMAMRDAGLDFPVFMTARDNGESLATIATPLDPSDDDSSRAFEIVCEIMGRRLAAVDCGAGNSFARLPMRRR